MKWTHNASRGHSNKDCQNEGAYERTASRTP